MAPARQSARLALVGAGRLAAHLGLALQAIGRPPVALGVRNAAKAAPLAARLGLTPVRPEQALEQADWVFLCVRDDAIAPLAASLPWQGQLAVHTSGATAVDALAPSRRRAGFHPLQLFSDGLPSTANALAAFAGVRVGIEADATAMTPLEELARALGAVPLPLGGGERMRYHAAANAAASGLFAPLGLAVQLWQQALGVDEAEALQALLPLARGALVSAERQGLAQALSGPVARGDWAVLQGHLAALDAQARTHYLALVRALVPLARRSGRLDAEALQRLDDLLNAGV